MKNENASDNQNLAQNAVELTDADFECAAQMRHAMGLKWPRTMKGAAKYCPRQYFGATSAFFRTAFYMSHCSKFPCRGCNTGENHAKCWKLILDERAGRTIPYDAAYKTDARDSVCPAKFCDNLTYGIWKNAPYRNDFGLMHTIMLNHRFFMDMCPDNSKECAASADARENCWKHMLEMMKKSKSY